jgi:peptidoglycan glycosyltransferase
VNARIGRLFSVVALAFLLLIGTVTYWQVWAAPGLDERRANPRRVYRELTIDRGRIFTADGVMLAGNRRERTSNGRDLYRRRYPQRGLAAHLQGYNSVANSRAGIELVENDYLTGAASNLSGGLENLFDQATGQQVTGNDVILTIRSRAQRAALGALRETGRPGAVVALEPATGRLLVMASWPTFDPNGDLSKVFAQQNGTPALNRATQGLYPPGSTFKVLTAAAGLEEGVVTPDRIFPGGACLQVYRRPFCNFRGETPRDHPFSEGLVHSYNTTFARLGQELGQERLVEWMRRFGFGARPPFDYPRGQIAASGLYERGKLSLPKENIDVARTAVGQGNLLATPLQMAMVAATIANRGVMMEPQAVQEIRSREGKRIAVREPRQLGRVLKAETADTVARIMGRVVEEGTGSGVRGIEGLPVAGKTGTAETGRGTLNDAWFIAFAPVERPSVAIAVVVEDTNETGGTAAAPIARQVLEALQGLGDGA